MHPELKNNGWHVVKVLFPPDSSEETRMSIGRFKDGNYHVLGYTPDAVRIYFSEREESLGDLGVVTLPKGKTSISDLVKGDLIQFAPEGKNDNPLTATYLRSG
jgi:hypothetical protein